MVGRIVILMEESNDFGIPYCNIGKSQSTPFGLAMSILPNFRPKIVIMMGKTKVWVIIRVSQKNQKSEFCYATNPSGFHRLAEPPKKFQHYRTINDIVQAIFSFTL